MNKEREHKGGEQADDQTGQVRIISLLGQTFEEVLGICLWVNRAEVNTQAQDRLSAEQQFGSLLGSSYHSGKLTVNELHQLIEALQHEMPDLDLEALYDEMELSVSLCQQQMVHKVNTATEQHFSSDLPITTAWQVIYGLQGISCC